MFPETKIWISDYGYDETLHGFEKSARKLGVDQIDLLILHQALPSSFERTLEAYRALADGHQVRAVVDVNVRVSGVLSATGRSAESLRATRDGHFELAVSEKLRDHGIVAEDPTSRPPVGSRDPDDDCLLALAINRRA